MKQTAALFLCLALAAGCQQQQTPALKPVKPATVILQSFMSLWTYISPLKVLNDCTVIDSAGAPVTKAAFVNSLATGRFLPLLLATPDSSLAYQLYPLPDTVGSGLKSTLKNWGERHLRHFNMIGKPLPPLQLTDLEGHTYSNESVKGKVLVLKCWFIHCAPCVAEMPALNEVVEQNSRRDDVLFVSLATDPADELRAFLAKKLFLYETVADSQAYVDTLGVRAYPTHLIVNREGVIAMMGNTWDEMEETFRKVTATNVAARRP